MSGSVLGIPQIVTRVGLAVPPDLYITQGSVPIPYFGDYDKAEVCTIGINPNQKEFASPKHPVSRANFHKSDTDTLYFSDVEKVINFCDIYFEPALKASKYPSNTHVASMWFQYLEEVLNYFNYSYGKWKNFGYGICNETKLHGDDGDVAVHFDLVQWSTDPTWTKLGTNVSTNNGETIRAALLGNDVPILAMLIQNKIKQNKLKAIFLDGRTAVEGFCRISGIPLTKVLAPFTLGRNKIKVYIYHGKYLGCDVRGWNIALSRMCPAISPATIAATLQL